MKLWPIEAYAIESPLSVAEIVVRLQVVTAPIRSWQRAPKSSFFVGRVTDSAFELRPVIYSMTSFLPELHGSFEPRPSGTLVRIDMLPSRATLTILAALFAFLAASIFDHDTRRVIMTTSGYITAGWTMVMAGFWLDGHRAEKKLRALLAPPGKRNPIAGQHVNGDAVGLG